MTDSDLRRLIIQQREHQVGVILYNSNLKLQLKELFGIW